MGGERTYTDEQLIDAVRSSASWRGTLRFLGLSATSAAAMRSVRFHADRLGADYRDFRGQRQWTDRQLREAVVNSRTWMDVADQLGLHGGSAVTSFKGHAMRLGLDTTHLNVERATAVADSPQPALEYLRRAGSMLAAGWFALCGRDVAWPLEPCRYDLLVMGDHETRRIQVKTTTRRTEGTWVVSISTSGRRKAAYDPDEVDDFFIIDGELNYYLIPIVAVGGLHALHLNAYERYRLHKIRGVGPNE